ncbi:PfkB family carbohydrate kinase [Kiritimatiella glycovorans]|uniref:Putative sugar kinase YdjH n=1 Tax=Kiritimatiella glycovorans TaxID=1307763 RepID=A0A0G3ECQ3_9BACT|nr:PfkB family carbohydrate kinase [Kiritimatiella glycovorans]AKJ64083.1 putative sugar kinase YdjH [Kiritimatiella glycovorans]
MVHQGDNPELIIVGSVGIDTIETPAEKRENVLGGSATYACAASSFFAPTGMVGVVGTDFPEKHREQWRGMGIDLDGLQTAEGETFRWSGVYAENMDDRETLETHLNVFADFAPDLPERYRRAPYVFLGNISPQLQKSVLDQVDQPKFVLLDTMDLWINIARDELEEVVGGVHMLTLNESEARLWTDEHSLLRAARRLLQMGPQYVLIKRGESGSLLVYGDEVFLLHAYPLEQFRDPTGAGDSFAGGLIGSLAESGEIGPLSIRRAMAYGSVTASFGVEEFSLERLSALGRTEIDERFARFERMCRF